MTADRNMAKVIDELRTIAQRARRLTVSRTNPHKFFEDRDDIGADIEVIAAKLERT